MASGVLVLEALTDPGDPSSLGRAGTLLALSIAADVEIIKERQGRHRQDAERMLLLTRGARAMTTTSNAGPPADPQASDHELERLLQQLRSADVTLRSDAAHALGKLADER